MQSTNWHKNGVTPLTFDGVACVSADLLGADKAPVTLTLRNLKDGSYLHSYLSCEEARLLGKQLLHSAAEVERGRTTKIVSIKREGDMYGRIGYAKWYSLVGQWDVCFSPTHRDWYADHEVEEVEEEV